MKNQEGKSARIDWKRKMAMKSQEGNIEMTIKEDKNYNF